MLDELNKLADEFEKKGALQAHGYRFLKDAQCIEVYYDLKHVEVYPSYPDRNGFIALLAAIQTGRKVHRMNCNLRISHKTKIP